MTEQPPDRVVDLSTGRNRLARQQTLFPETTPVSAPPDTEARIRSTESAEGPAAERSTHPSQPSSGETEITPEPMDRRAAEEIFLQASWGQESLHKTVQAAGVLTGDVYAQLFGARAAIRLRDVEAAQEFLSRARILAPPGDPYLREDLTRLGVALTALQQRQRATLRPAPRKGTRPRGAQDRGGRGTRSGRAPPEPPPTKPGPSASPALSLKLTPLAPLGSDIETDGSIDPAQALADFRLRQAALEIERLQSFETLLALGEVRGVERFEYQIRTVTRVLREFYGRVLLADEVGLGKTVEACLCLKEYLLRGLVARALILVPPGLRAQWRDELENKFGILAHVLEAEEARADAEAWRRPGVLIASLGLARLEPHARHIAENQFDLVVVDEAHRLKNRTTRSWQLVDGLRARFLLLLSATPVENELIEIYNLLSLLKPGLFSTEAEFRRAFIGPGKGRTVKDPSRLRALLREVMIRNTRALAEARLPPRFATTLRAAPGPEEAGLYAAVARAVRSRIQAGSMAPSSAGEILRAAGSSPAAAAPLLEQRLDPALGRAARSIGDLAKDRALLDLLARRSDEKVLLFAAQRATLEHLHPLVQRAGRRPALFHGQLSAAQKEQAMAAFAGDCDVLVSSESGGEGFNLQFARTIVNYDLPWNPMRIEQRIGRVHRIGQTRDVFIFNLVTAGTVEEEILRVLDEKINMFELVVGEIEAILGRLGDDEQEFQDLVLELYTRSSSEQELRARFDELGERMLSARGAHERTQRLEEAAFGRELEA